MSAEKLFEELVVRVADSPKWNDTVVESKVRLHDWIIIGHDNGFVQNIHVD